MTGVQARDNRDEERNPVCATCSKEHECGQLPWVEVISCEKMVPLDRERGSLSGEK